MQQRSPAAKPPAHLPAVKDHSRQYSGFQYVYPVISRRSRGLSLGVNLNPDKICNFNCIYCEVDRHTPGRAQGVDPVCLGQELQALIRHIKQEALLQEEKFRHHPALAGEIRDIAFSGDGEPTLAPNFAACVETVAAVKRQESLDRTKIVLITNAAGLDKTDVRRGLEIMDANQGEIWGKLDAGTEVYYRRVNRAYVQFERLLRNLLETARIRPIIIQSLFLKIHGEIMPETELTAYCQRITDLHRQGAQISEIHAYTIARPTPETYAVALSEEELSRLAAVIRERTGLRVDIFP